MAERLNASIFPQQVPRRCGHLTAPHWVPHGFIWCAAVPYLVYLYSTSTVERNRPYNIVYRVRVILAALTVVTALLEFVLLEFRGESEELWLRAGEMCVNVASQVLAAVVMLFELRRGLHPPIIPVLFWFCLLSSRIGVLQAVVLADNDRQVLYFPNSYVCSPHLAACAIMCLYCFICDCCIPTKSFLSLSSNMVSALAKKKVDPYFWSSLLCRMTLLYTLRNVWKSKTRAITMEDIYEYQPGDDSKALQEKVEASLRRQQKASKSRRRWRWTGAELEEKQSLLQNTEKKARLGSLLQLLYDTESTPRPSPQSISHPVSLTKLFFIILRIMIRPTFIIFLVRFFYIGIRVAALLSLRDLLHFIESGDTDTRWGVVLVCRFSMLTLFYDVCDSPWYYVTYYSGAQMRGLLGALLMKQYMMMPPVLRRNLSADITSYITVDVHRVSQVFSEANYTYEVLLLMLPGAIILYSVLGVSGLLGLGFMIGVFAFIMVLFTKYVLPLKAQEVKVKDRRVKLMESILKGIKRLEYKLFRPIWREQRCPPNKVRLYTPAYLSIVKSYAWENALAERVQEERRTELSFMKRVYLLQGLGVGVALAAPFLAVGLIITTYVLSSSSNEVTADRIFTAMTVIWWFVSGCVYVPHGISYIVQGYVSMKRILIFLQTSMKPKLVARKKVTSSLSGDIINFYHATLAWDSTTPVLHSINLTVKPGELVAVVGRVGAGKSSLLSAILGELSILSGDLSVQGSVAFTSQHPWTLCDTIRENIVFGATFDEKMYLEVITACELSSDIETMEGNDLCHIGEHSATLSGGQKHRINLARAVYADKDVYLLDDPLSAVDARVALQIFQQVIGRDGLLHKKTRILVTHSIQFLHLVDRIIIIDEGRIVQTGTYDDLMRSKCDLVNYIQETDMPEEATSPEQMTRVLTVGESADDDSKYLKDGLDSYELVSSYTLVKYIRAAGIWKGVLVVVITVAISALQVGSTLWLAYWSSDWRTSPSTASELTPYRLGVFIVLGIVQGLVSLGGVWALTILSLSASEELHSQLLERTLHTEPTRFDFMPVGVILNWFTKDTDNIDTSIISNLWLMMYTVTYVIGIVFFIIFSVPLAIPLYIGTAIVSVFIAIYHNSYAYKIMMLDGVVRSPLFSCMEKIIKGIVTIKTYGRTEHFFNKFCNLTDKSTRTFWNFAAIKEVVRLLEWTLCRILSVILMLLCVYYRENNPSVMSAFAYTISLSIHDAATLMETICKLGFSLASVERVLSTKYLTREADWFIQKATPAQDWPANGQITFINYSAKYPTSTETVLQSLTFTIGAHEKVGIVGRTGAGKSSLAAALCRMLVSVSGRIVIDGVDIGTLGLHDLRSRVTLITQDPVVFVGSIRANIDPFHEFDDADLWTALEKVHLKSVVLAIPGGLLAECGEDGIILSTGQRHLLCLVRALLRKSTILVLDEPTASVDVHTDELIQETLRKHLNNCTLITIAHRIKTIIDYDRVMVLEDGKIIEFDDPSKLLANKNSVLHSLAKKSGIISEVNMG